MMNFDFSTIKLESPTTLSQLLLNARMDLGLELIEVESRTKIRRKYLEALERDQLFDLPSIVYVHGFLKQLSRVYSLDADDLIRLFNKERNIALHIEPIIFSPPIKEIKKISFITPIKVFIVAITSAIIMLLIYAGYHLFGSMAGPKLIIFSPKNNVTVSNYSLNVAGQTDPDAVLTINGQNVGIDIEGKFLLPITLSRGANTLYIISERSNKQTSQLLEVLVRNK